ncbi:hypothetical protein BDW72DRAFT_25974 [Aspergillus terricola var. indicus]
MTLICESDTNSPYLVLFRIRSISHIPRADQQPTLDGQLVIDVCPAKLSSYSQAHLLKCDPRANCRAKVADCTHDTQIHLAPFFALPLSVSLTTGYCERRRGLRMHLPLSISHLQPCYAICHNQNLHSSFIIDSVQDLTKDIGPVRRHHQRHLQSVAGESASTLHARICHLLNRMARNSVGTEVLRRNSAQILLREHARR